MIVCYTYEVTPYAASTRPWVALRWAEGGPDERGYPVAECTYLGSYPTRALASLACREDLGPDPYPYQWEGPTPIEALGRGPIDPDRVMPRGDPRDEDPLGEWADAELAEARAGSGHGYGPDAEPEPE